MPRHPLVIAALAAALPLAGAHAQARRPMAIEDLITAVRVGDPQLSPDGRRVLFTRTTTDASAGRRNADIWTVPADGSAPPTPFITSPKGDDTPRYLPDGGVAFLSSRDGATQVYVADGSGANVRAVTHQAAGAQGPLVVSPNGRMVAYVVDVFPACTTDACNTRMSDSAAKDPVKVHTLSRLPFRHWSDWWESVRHHVFVTDIASGDTRDLTPGDFDSPPHNYEDGAIAFSSDSRELAFVSKRGGAKDSEMWTTNHDVWTVPVAGGAVRKVTSNPAADMQPTYSPDGKWLVVRAQRRAGFEGDRWYLDAYDRTSGAKHTLFTSPDLSVDDFHFSPDGRTIWFSSANNGTQNLYSVPASGGTPALAVQGGAVAAFQPGSGFIVYARSSLVAPADIYRMNADGTTRQLTNENAGWLAMVDLPKPRSMTVTGAAGARVQYWLLRPPNFDASKKYPVVFMLHGGPQGDWADGWSNRWNPSLWASQGWIVAAPNPRGSTGFGQKFVDEISQDWCGKVMTDFNAVFDAVARSPNADASRMGIAGASYGGYAVNWLIGHTNRFKAAVSHDGVFNLESMSLTTEELWFTDWEFGGAPWTAAARKNFARCSPHLSANKIRTPTFVITNEQDFRVPVDQGLQLFTALRRNGVPSKGLVFENEGHWVLNALDSRRWHQEVFAWMHKYLAPVTP
ncbi:MAG: S9 family peptidase [Polaromonas sp.]|nr:S9 family peptidase [Gemmatimonadaceae bacterium]